MLTKKYRLVFGLVLMMAGVLSVCSSTANTTNSGNEQQAQKLAQRTIGKLNKQKSLQVTLNSRVKSTTTSKKRKKTENYEYTMAVAYQKKPDVMRIETTIVTGKKTSAAPVYLNDYDVYTKPNDGQWVKTAANQAGFDFDTQKDQYAAVSLLKRMATSSKLHVKTRKGQYILTYRGHGDSATEMVKDALGVGNPGNDSGMGAVIDQMNVESFDYQIVIDRHSLLPQSYQGKIKMTTKDGTKVAQTQSLKGKFSQYNQVPTITLPEAKRVTTTSQTTNN